jgi:hypothetical protein
MPGEDAGLETTGIFRLKSTRLMPVEFKQPLFTPTVLRVTAAVSHAKLGRVFTRAVLRTAYALWRISCREIRA